MVETLTLCLEVRTGEKQSGKRKVWQKFLKLIKRENDFFLNFKNKRK